LVPLLLLMLFMGIYPSVFLDRSKASIEALRTRVTRGQSGGTFETTELRGKESGH
jgi:NADH:ubiquinone oxidoreductase subunit 4 (subunit M)